MLHHVFITIAEFNLTLKMNMLLSCLQIDFFHSLSECNEIPISTIEQRGCVLLNNATAILATGAEVRHDIDATKLREAQPPLDAQGAFDQIIFNFPHIDGKNKIKYAKRRAGSYLNSVCVAAGFLMDTQDRTLPTFIQ